MRVGILSMQEVNNMGSLLQAYSLKKMVEELGEDCYFIDIEPNKNDEQIMEKVIPRQPIRNNVIKEKIRGIDRYFWNRIRIRKIQDEQDVKFEEFREKILGCSHKVETQLDLAIIGSDEVFNCLERRSRWGFTSQLFGNVQNAEEVITYAASCGYTSYSEVPKEIKTVLSESLTKVKSISVRDENTKEFVYKLTGRTPIMHFDPVVVGSFDDEIKNIELPEILDRPYCVVYSYYNRISDRNEIKSIIEFCKKNSLRIVTIGAPQMWVNAHLALSPFQALKAFQNASFVITDTFHGTIFSYKYAKKYAVITRSSNSNKLNDLIERLKIQEHKIMNLSEIAMVSNYEDDKNIVKELERREYLRSISYLREHIKG